ncbi:MAG: 23S rRNA (pseudouridine(1915)-N(3))-methyltransferase RlmH [Pseudomonadota bacterium]
MRLWVFAVGRERDSAVETLVDRYRERSPWPLKLETVDVKKGLKGQALKAAEGELLLGKVPESARIVALDERGDDLTSVQLAVRLGKWRDTGSRDIAFLIGGADGFDARIRERADLVLRLGRLTWPHMMVRAMLAEQLYRAQMILSGHPYHRP